MLDPTSGKLTAGPLKHGDTAWHASFSSEGSRIITASSDHTATIWDARTGDKFAGPFRQDRAFPMAFSPDGSKLVSVNDGAPRVAPDATANVRDVETCTNLGSASVPVPK